MTSPGSDLPTDVAAVPTREEIGRRLKALVRRKGFRSVRAAAISAGVNYSQLSDLIHGRKSPTVETLEEIVTKLGGTLHDVLCEPSEG
jgi:transcriptional regulator with XRE-family HTH domain